MKNTIALLVLVGIFKAGEGSVTAWSKPDIKAPEGSGTLIEKINNGVSTGDTGITITATSTNAATYTKASQDPTYPVLAIDSRTGVVTVTSGIIEYSSVTSFTLVVTADDGGASTATVTLSVNVAPSFSSHNISRCIADGAVAGTDLIDLTATDANTDSIKYEIASGNTGNVFTIIQDTGVIEVATGMTLNMATTSTYNLVITAEDDSSTPLTATTTVTATVSLTCSGAAALAVTFMAVLSALIVSL